MRKNHKVIKNDNDQLVVENYPKNKNKQPIIQKQLPNCPSCKKNGKNLIKDTIAKIVNLILTNKNIRLIKTFLRQDRDFSTRLNYANKNIQETWMKVVKTTYNSTEDMID